MRRRLRTVVRAPVELWARSLPFRVVSSTLAAVLAILALTGWFLMDQSTRGIVDTKKAASLSEASLVLDSMQRQLRTVDTRISSVSDKLTQLARDAAMRGSVGGQYHIVVAGPVSDIVSAGIEPRSIPDAVRTAVVDADGLVSASTALQFSDGRASEPGLVVAGAVQGPGNVRYPVYLLFSLSQEQTTLQAVQQAAALTGFWIVISLGATGYLVALLVIRPVRAARRAAERMAEGNLTTRMKVVGTEDMASLASSMNHLAEELDRKISQLEGLSSLQQRFVSDVSHELRTPLTTVRMAADVLNAHRSTLDPVMQRSVELLHAELERFEDLLAELLEISRFDSGAAQLVAEEQDVSALVREEVEAQRPLADAQGVPVEVDILGPCPAEVDARRVRRIIRNLLTNAIEHADGKPVEVHVRGDDRAVAVAVRDYGVGFSADQADRVFDRFWRADPARDRRLGGTGLGLSISLEDAKLHGGWLHAWGRPGLGAQFRLTLPTREGSVLQSAPLPVVPDWTLT